MTAPDTDQFGDEVEYTTEFLTDNPPYEDGEDTEYEGGAPLEDEPDDPEIGHVEPEGDEDAGKDDDAF